jgi:hypothetical protein
MMPYHRFKVGQTVYAPPGGLDALDGREWAVLERQIRLVEERPALPEPPPPRPPRTRGKSARRA